MPNSAAPTSQRAAAPHAAWLVQACAPGQPQARGPQAWALLPGPSSAYREQCTAFTASLHGAGAAQGAARCGRAAGGRCTRPTSPKQARPKPSLSHSPHLHGHDHAEPRLRHIALLQRGIILEDLQKHQQRQWRRVCMAGAAQPPGVRPRCPVPARRYGRLPRCTPQALHLTRSSALSLRPCASAAVAGVSPPAARCRGRRPCPGR